MRAWRKLYALASVEMRFFPLAPSSCLAMAARISRAQMCRRQGVSPSSVKRGSLGSLSRDCLFKELDRLGAEHYMSGTQFRRPALSVSEPEGLPIEIGHQGDRD